MSLTKRKILICTLIILFFISLVCLFTRIPIVHAYAYTTERESNNTYSSANTIALNSFVSGNLSTSSDVDWYKFTTTEDGYFNIEFNHTILSSGGSYWQIFLYDSATSSIIDSRNSYFSVPGNKNYTSCNMGVPAGTYYVQIECYYYSNVTYQMRVNFTASNNWETEVNNEKENADTISINDTYHGALSSSNDVDWYKFEIKSTNKFAISFNHAKLTSSRTYWQMWIYTYNGTKSLMSFASRGDTVNGVSDYIQLGYGTYYLKISSYIYSGIDYSFAIVEEHECIGGWSVTKAPTCLDKGIESRSCTICGKVDTREVDATGHINDEGLVIKETTIFRKGVTDYTCTACGEKETVEDKSKVWVLPVIIGGIVIFAFGIFNYIRILKKKE